MIDHRSTGPPERRDAAIARLLSYPLLRYDAMLVGLAAAFNGADPFELLEQLDEAARPLLDVRDRELSEQTSAVLGRLSEGLGLRVDADDHRALLLDHALVRRRAHPMVIAGLGHELARRAGLTSLVVTYAGRHWAALIGPGPTAFLIGSDAPSPAVDLAPDGLRPCPAHELAFATLCALAINSPPSLANRAARLCRMLELRMRSGTDTIDDAGPG